MKQIKMTIMSLLLLLTSIFWTARASAADAPKVSVAASACVVMDMDTLTVLYEKNKDEKHYPASTTKLMTALLVMEQGNLDDTVTFSSTAIGSITADSSQIGISAGETLSLREALYAVLIASANEVSNGVAEHIAGSMDAFVDMMNSKAAQLGCHNTHFTNAHGLHNDDHYTTAYDMALIASNAGSNEALRDITGMSSYTVTAARNGQDRRIGIQTNHRMVNGTYEYRACIGGKTGYTMSAQNTLVTYASRDGRNLVCVILYSPTTSGAYTDTASALEYGFYQYDQLGLVPASAKAADDISTEDDHDEKDSINEANENVTEDDKESAPQDQSNDTEDLETASEVPDESDDDSQSIPTGVLPDHSDGTDNKQSMIPDPTDEPEESLTPDPEEPSARRHSTGLITLPDAVNDMLFPAIFLAGALICLYFSAKKLFRLLKR